MTANIYFQNNSQTDNNKIVSQTGINKIVSQSDKPIAWGLVQPGSKVVHESKINVSRQPWGACLSYGLGLSQWID
jgi:hypothetical protein